MNKTPQEVKKDISLFFKKNKVPFEEAAKKIGYGSTQTLYNALSKREYFSKTQAQRYAAAYPFNIAFLTTGEGELESYPPSLGSSGDRTILPFIPWTINNMLTWIKSLAFILKDSDISEFYEYLYQYVYFDDIFIRQLVELCENTVKKENYELFKRGEIVDKIKRVLNKLENKYKYGAIPAKQREV